MAMQLAFHEKLADQRKDWIRNWQPDFRVEEMQMQPISAFINHELIQFSIADVARSIPRFMDGLKQVQRKIIWGSMKKWKGKVGSNKAAKIKVGNLASYVSEKTEYHHGPKSLCDAIVHMVHDLTGSNNLPYFCANGQFGTRNYLGKDASEPRYTKTRPQWWWNLIFKKEDMPLLDIVIDEGKECEPVTFLPIIPLHLINGTSGIGTGHSTFVPDHDPLDICRWLTAKINGYPLPEVLPWYRGFTGDIKIIDRTSKPKNQSKPKTPQPVVSPNSKSIKLNIINNTANTTDDETS
jgi:DNA topoisomerase-2